ncbi:MAG: glycosyltransferase family 87 protein [Candidatus Dormibacterales bacterium]
MAAAMATLDLVEWIRLVGPRFGVDDFRLYFGAARIGLIHGWTHIYDVGLQRAAVEHLTLHTAWVPYLNPPVLAWLVAPFTYLPFPAAFAAWTFVMAGCLVGACLLVAPPGPLARVTYVLLALGLFPVAWNLWSGQVAPLVALGVAACVRLEREGHSVAAGAVLAVIVLKPQIAFLVPLALLLSGHRRLFASWLAATAMVLVASAASLGVIGIQTFLHDLSLAAGFPDQQRWSLLRLTGGGAAAWIAEAAVIGSVLALAWKRGGLAIPAAAALVGSLLGSRYMNPQDLVVLAVAGGLLAAPGLRRWQICLLGAGWVAVELAQAVELPLLAAEVAALAALWVWERPSVAPPAASQPALLPR